MEQRKRRSFSPTLPSVIPSLPRDLSFEIGRSRSLGRLGMAVGAVAMVTGGTDS
jgi:hypothetical protein